MGLPVAHFEILAWLRDKARDRHVLAEDVLKLIAEESASKETKNAAQREAQECCLLKLSSEHRTLVLAAYDPDSKIETVAKKSKRTLYENGNLAAKAKYSPLARRDMSPIGIGTSPAGYSFWNGRIDELALFERALSVKEITDLYQSAQRKEP